VAKYVSSEVEIFSCPSPRFGDRASVTLELVSRVKKALKSRRGFGIERIRFFVVVRNCVPLIHFVSISISCPIQKS